MAPLQVSVNQKEGLRFDAIPSFSAFPAFVFFVVLGAGIAASVTLIPKDSPLFAVGLLASIVSAVVVSSSIKVIPEWERAVVLRLGSYVGQRGPGFFMVIPIFEQIRRVDTRIITRDIPSQQAITKDNVPVLINGVLYFKVMNVGDAVIKVQDYSYAISQYAQTALRDVIGGMTLDELLSEREKIGNLIELSVEHESKKWGLEVTSIKLQDIDMPEELKKMMSRQASAEREKRATITKAEGDKLAAFNLAEAARTMHESPGAMQLRTLQTIDGLGPTASNTVVLAVPVEILDAVLSIARSRQAAG
jgi:regulator of protease activity HflC (stomatin/prohibitin superfamily)